MMYTITRGPSKLVTQRRTGPTQQLDNKINDFKHKQTSWNMPEAHGPSLTSTQPTLLKSRFKGLPAPKIVFNRLNGKKHHQPAQALPADSQHEETFSPAHEENVKFVSEAWEEVVQQEDQRLEASRRAVHYKETSSGQHMDSFVPIDLDEWWAQRFLANIDKLS